MQAVYRGAVFGLPVGLPPFPTAPQGLGAVCQMGAVPPPLGG